MIVGTDLYFTITRFQENPGRAGACGGCQILTRVARTNSLDLSAARSNDITW